MPVTFEELEGSPTFNFDDGKFTGTREFKVDWENWPTFIGELYGVYSLTGGTVTSTSPATFPGVPQAICTDARGGPQRGLAPTKSGEITLTNGNAVTYPHAFITATYKIPFQSDGQSRADLPSVPSGTYLDYTSDHGAEYLTLPGRDWEWDGTNDKLPADIAPGIIMPTEEFTLTWSRVTSPPWNAIRDTKGKINGSTFLNHAAGKVLFMGARARKSFQLSEQTFWTLHYAFRVRAQEWNRFYHKDNGWTKVDDGSGNPPYASGTFSNLFQFG